MDDFSSIDDRDFSLPSVKLLEAMVDTFAVKVEVLKPVRDGKEIIGFEYIILDEGIRKNAPKLNLTEKRFFDLSTDSSNGFSKLVEVITSGTTQFGNSVLKVNGSVQSFKETYVKSGEFVIVFRGQVIDGTDKEIEHELQEDIHLIRQVMDTTPDIIYIMDLNTHQLIYCNRNVATDLGYNIQEIAKMKNPILDIMHKDDISAMLAHVKGMATVTSDQTVVEIEYRLRNADGSYAWFNDRNSVFRRNNAEEPIEKIGICQNVTRRKEEEELRLTGEEIFQQAEEIVAIGSWEYDILEDKFKWSKGMYRLFNLERNEKVRPEIYLEYSKSREIEIARRVVNNILHDFVDFEETITLALSGQPEKIVKIKAIVQHDQQRRPVKIIGVDLDITQQVRATEAINELYDSLLKKNQELSSLSQEIKTFNSVAAHDYKETLQQLYTNFEYIITNDARNLSSTGKGNIRRAQSAIQRMHLLTDDINSYFRLYDLLIKLSPVDSSEILIAVLNEHKSKLEQYNAKVEYVDLPVLQSNTELLSLLFTNLIDNAIRFRNLLVPLVIKLEYSPVNEMNATSGALKNTQYGVISVTDNGIGFSQSEAEKIFEIFYRRIEAKERGTDIGLAICKKVMNLHGGHITAKGRPSQGATFNCYFPLASPENP